MSSTATFAFFVAALMLISQTRRVTVVAAAAASFARAFKPTRTMFVSSPTRHRFSVSPVARTASLNNEEDDMTDPSTISSARNSAAAAAAAASFDTQEDNDEEDDDDVLYIATKIPTKDSPSWSTGNSFDDFLNQCTIQSFMFLLKTCRDPQTVLWIEKFTQPIIGAPPRALTNEPASGGTGHSKLLSYHGLAAMNTTAFATWDSYFAQLMEQPQEFYTVESNQAHIPSYEMDIHPPSLCTRMMSVREQIAREFAKDLTVLQTMGGMTLQAYWQGIRKHVRGDGDAVADDDPLRSGFAGSLLFLDADPDEESDYQPSPLRKGNFDLLVLLATQESIHRALNSAHSQPSTSIATSTSLYPMTPANRRYLSNFYLNRLVSHFTGRQRYGRADQFLQELLSAAPSMTMVPLDVPNDDSSGGDDVQLVDPTRIAEQILEIRQEVAYEWALRAASAPELHMEIKRLQLNLLMKSYSRTDDGFQ